MVHHFLIYPSRNERVLPAGFTVPFPAICSRPYVFPIGCSFSGFNLAHKHLPEMAVYSKLDRKPIFCPAVGSFEQGMVVSRATALRPAVRIGARARRSTLLLRRGTKAQDSSLFAILTTLQNSNEVRSCARIR